SYEILYDGTAFQLLRSLAFNGAVTINRSGSTGKTDDLVLTENGYAVSESHNLQWQSNGAVLGRLGVEYDGSDCWLYVRDVWGNGNSRTGISFGVRGTNGTPANYVYAQAGTTSGFGSLATNASDLKLSPGSSNVQLNRDGYIGTSATGAAIAVGVTGG